MGILDVPFDSVARRIALPGNGLIMAMGDSITANDYTAPTSTTAQILRPRQYLLWAAMLSNGGLRYGGVAGTGGFTSAQVISTHLPTILAAKPQFCVVHAGTNDPGTLTLAQTIANLQSMYDQLLNAGIVPIATTMLPKQTLINASARTLQLMSQWIMQYARKRGFPCVDWNRLFVDTANGGWSGYSGGTGPYNGDDTHPNGAGAKIMGQAIVDALAGQLGTASFIPTANYTPGTLSPNSATNALWLTDTNADGTPDGATSSAGTGVTYTLSAMSAGEGLGNWWNLNKNGTGTPFGQVSCGSAAVPGNKMLLVCRVKTTGVKTAGAQWHIRLTDNNTVDVVALRQMTEDITLGLVALEFTVPASVGATSLKLVPTIDTGSGTATLSVGQVGIYDLTALGTVA